MSQEEERQAWTEFFERGDSASSRTAQPGECGVCFKQIPADRLLKKLKSCSVACGRQMQSEKYGGQKVEFNGRWFDSLREAKRAQLLQMLEAAGKIEDLKYQVRIVLVAAQPPLRAITYIADFIYRDSDTKQRHVEDAKGFKTQVYRLKKRAAALLLGLEIEDV